MKNIKSTHKIHKTDKNIEKMPFTQLPTLLHIGCFWQYFVRMSIVSHINLISFFKFCTLQQLYVKVLILCTV